MTFTKTLPGRLSVCVSIIILAQLSRAGDATVTESKEKIDNAEHTVVALENDRIRVEIEPDMQGKLMQFSEKGHGPSLLQGIAAYTLTPREHATGAGLVKYTVDANGPERAAVTLSYRKTLEFNADTLSAAAIANGAAHENGRKRSTEIAVERTLSIGRSGTRLLIETKVTNIGDGAVPAAAPGVVCEFSAPPGSKDPFEPRWFLPGAGGGFAEMFDTARGAQDMAEANYGEGAPVHHRFSTFTPGVSADNPRYAAGGWAVVTGQASQTGRVFVNYDAASAAFVQYSLQQHPRTRLTLDPRALPEDLKPGASRTTRLTLALDPADVTGDLSTLALGAWSIPATIHAGETLTLNLPLTTVLAPQAGRAALQLNVKTSAGAAVAGATAEAPLRAGEITAAGLKCKLLDTIAPGAYTWELTIDGKNADAGNLIVARGEETVIAAAGSVLKIAPERLEQLKRGGDWWYDQITRGVVSGSLHLVLNYNDAERTFTLNKTRQQAGWTIASTAVYSAERTPVLKKFSMDLNGQKLSAEMNGATLAGADIDGDGFELHWRADMLPDCALPFAAMAMDWGRGEQFRFSILETSDEDLLPPELIVPRRERKTPGEGRVPVVCDVVRLNDMYYAVDDAGRIVELSDAVRPDVWRLTESPKYKPELKLEGDAEPIDDAVAQLMVDKVAANPPATGQLVQTVLPKAARAGLLPGDIITLYDGSPIDTYAMLRNAVTSARNAQKESVEIRFVRGAETKKANVGVGTIGVQCSGVVKGQPIDLENAMFAGMGFGPGPKPPPTALEKLAREKCGSQITWLTDYDKALAQAKQSNKPILWWATPIHGASIYKLKMFNDYLKMGLFTYPVIVNHINTQFTPYTAPLTKKQMEAFGLKHLTAPALLFVAPDGKFLAELDGLTSLEPEFFRRYLDRIADRDNPSIIKYGRNENLAPPVAIDPTAGAFYAEGQGLALDHNGDGAAAALTRALELAKSRPRAGHNPAQEPGIVLSDLAWVLIHSNHPDKALEVLREGASTVSPRGAEERFAEGVALLMLNRDAEARAVWKDAAEKNPDNPWGWRCAAEAEGLGPISRGAESPLWVDLSAIDDAKELKDLPHSTTLPALAGDAKAAAKAGVEFLLMHQEADGGWNDTQYDFGGISAMPNVRTAVTAICAEALLTYRDTDPERIDAALQKAWAYLIDGKHITWTDKNEIIWAHIYRMNFFAAFLRSCSPGLKTQVRDEMQKISDTLTHDNIGPHGFYRHEYENEFVTASVLLSLRLAKDAGIAVDERATKRACDALESVRTPRGTWPYDTTPNPDTAWKGSSGRAVVCEAGLLAWDRGSPERLKHAIEKYLRYNFVQDRVRKETFHSDRYGVAGFFYWYNQHTLSQAARLADPDTAHDAAEFMKKLVLSRREIDGTWVDSLELGKTYATGLALLVLKAGTGL